MKKFIPAIFVLFNVLPASSVTITVPLTYSAEAGDSGSLTGSFTIDTSLDGSNQRNTDLGFTTIPNWITAVELSYTDSLDASKNFTRSKAAGTITNMVWEVKSGATPNFSGDIVGQDVFDGLGFAGLSLTANLGSLGQDASENEFVLVQTPSPLPFLGCLAFIFYTRKFKKYTL